ncbi:MAG: hypothetical protein JRF60_17680 [Deltaproteobacteria bacterium]|nr:hypothetical protein [Deltaproteobacteria bacterium]
MKIYWENKQKKEKWNKQQRLFLQFWYSMVHRRTLDSHRPKCMFSINILEELQNLISKVGFLPVDIPIKFCAEETIQLLDNDIIINKEFSHNWKNLKPFLEGIITETEKKSKKEKILHSHYKNASYYLKDFLVRKNDYLDSLIIKLNRSIDTDEPETDIHSLTSTLLSLVINEGHSIESLFTLIISFFLKDKKNDGNNFEDNFQTMIEILKKQDLDYNIILKLEGWRKPDLVPQSINNISFSENINLDGIEIKSNEEQFGSFMAPHGKTLFASILIKAKDSIPAGVIARDFCFEVLDLLRFELEQETVSINQSFVAVNPNKDSAKLFKFPSNIPNPREAVGTDEFKIFANMTASVLNSAAIEDESKNKIKSALRLYRMGKDSENFENKFLHWWNGLEYLARGMAKISIIDDVENKAIPLLILNYTSKHLEKFRSVFTSFRIKPPGRVCEEYATDNFVDLPITDIFKIMRDDTEYAEITNQLDYYPIVKFYLDRFKDNTKDSESIKIFLESHTQGLRWHLHRLWRIRCDIVHSAAYSLNLTLLSANLEFYLKTLITNILIQFSRNPAITSLEELFSRFDQSYENLMKDLENSIEDSFLNTLDGYI